VVSPVLKFRKEKQTFAKLKGGNVDFFLTETTHERKIGARVLRAARENSDKCLIGLNVALVWA
jgi:hypothetical protein